MPRYRVFADERQTIRWQMMVTADSEEEAEETAFNFLEFGVNDGVVDVEEQSLVSTENQIVEVYRDHG